MSQDTSTNQQEFTSPSMDPVEIITNLKLERRCALTQFTRHANQLARDIEAQRDSKAIISCKSALDTCYDKCMSVCNELLCHQTGEEKSNTLTKIEEVELRQKNLNSKYTVYLAECVSMTASEPSPSFFGSRRSGSVCSNISRISVASLKIDAQQKQREAQLRLQQLHLSQQRAEEEAEEEAQDARRKSLEAEENARRKKRVAAYKTMEAELELEKELSRVEAEVRKAEIEFEISSGGSEVLPALPSIALRRYDQPTKVRPMSSHLRPIEAPRQAIDPSRNPTQHMPDAVVLPQITLDVFHGDILEYESFISQFDVFIDSKSIDDAVKFQYLLKYCDGRALNTILGCKPIQNKSEAYKEARRRLNKKFRAEDLMVEAAMENLITGPIIAESDSDALNDLSSAMYRFKNTLKAAGHELELDSRETISKIFQRLPKSAQQDYLRRTKEIKHLGRKPNYDDLFDFVDELSESSTDYYQRLYFTSEANKPTIDVKKRLKPIPGD